MSFILYDSYNISQNKLIKNFIVRNSEFKNILNYIKHYTNKNKLNLRNYLIQGDVGSGKTTLLLRLKYEIKKELNIISILFNEEELYIYNIEIFFKIIFDKLLELDIKINSIDELNKYILENNLILIVFIDDILRLFDSFNSESDIKNFKRFINYKNIKLVATYSFKNSIYYANEDFFKTFQEVILKGLHTLDVIKYLTFLSKDKKIKNYIQNNPKKVKTFKYLTDGNLRLMALLFEDVFIQKDFELDVEHIIDILKIYYRHYLQFLSSVQRYIINNIAKYDQIRYQELIKLCINNDTLNVELVILQDNNLIEKVYVDGDVYFKIKHILLKILLLSNNQSNKIQYLMHLIDILYDDNKLFEEVNYYKKILQKAKVKFDILERIYIIEALNQNYIKRFQDNKLIDEVNIALIDYLLKHNLYYHCHNIISMMIDDYYFKKAFIEYKNKKYKKSVEYLEEALKIDSDNFIFWSMLVTNYKQMKKIHNKQYINSCKKAIINFNIHDQKISKLNSIYIEIVYEYIFYYFYKENNKMINSLMYYTDILFEDFKDIHKKYYLESIKIFLLSHNIELANKLLKNYLDHNQIDQMLETIFNILYMKGYWQTLFDFFNEYTFLQKEYKVIFYAILKSLNKDIKISSKMDILVKNFIDHFYINKQYILKIIRANIIQNRLY